MKRFYEKLGARYDLCSLINLRLNFQGDYCLMQNNFVACSGPETRNFKKTISSPTSETPLKV